MRYDENDTIWLIGQQNIDLLMNETVRNQMDEIAAASPGTTTRETARNMFLLGFIYGKRAERARRKKGSTE
ncbi:MAG: hypothetical protein ACOYBL_06230 [Lachnospiraceae bacterium]|jgi:hypothetical protein